MASLSSSSEPTASAPSFRTFAARWIRPLTATTLALLAAQFLIGMLTSFFFAIPFPHPGANADNYFGGVVSGVWWSLGYSFWELQLHVVVGLLLGLACIALLAFAIILRSRAWIIATTLGFIGIVGAGFNGASYMNYLHWFSAFIMSIGFLLALTSYALGLYYTKDGHSHTPSP
jgi:hypothetical protein